MTAAERRKREDLLVRLACDSISAFQRGDIGFERLVRDVGNVVDELDGLAESAWVGRLRRNWAELEILWSLALADDRATLTPEEEGDVERMLASLRTTMAQRAAA